MKRSLFLAVGLAVLVSMGSAAAWAQSADRGRGQVNDNRDRDRNDRGNHGGNNGRVNRGNGGRGGVGAPVPEPTSALIFGTALLITGISTRRRS